MLLQRLSNASIRKWSAALALVTMLGGIQQPLVSGAANTVSTPLRISASIAQADGAGQTQSTALSMADALFSGVVRQAFQSQKLSISGMQNALDWSAVQIGNGISGSAGWQVDGTDETGAGAHFQGTLSFDLEGDQQTGNGLGEISGLDTPAGGTHIFTGTFQSADSALDFSARLSSHTARGNIATESRYDVSLTRNGATSRVISTSAGTVETPAYGFTRLTTKGTLERDGNSSEWTNVTTARNHGSGETEVWQEMDAPQNSSGPAHITQHSSQRIAGSSISQYVDRMDVTRDGKNYKLLEPGTVTGTMSGDFATDLVLVDSDGNKTDLSKLQGGLRPPGLSSPLRQFSGAGPVSPEEAALLLGLMVGGLIIMSGGAAGILLLGGSLSGLSGSLIIGGAIFSAAMGSAGIIRSANADPYFVVADTRPNSDPIGPSGAQITHVTGGLIPTPPPAPSLGANAVISQSVSGSAGFSAEDSANAAQPYDDDPVPFVGGSLPAGSQSIGEWTWDKGMQYGAIPSHTQAAQDGSQLHYFVHATNPLKPGPDTNIVQYVYLDPANPPAELYMQFYTGKGDGEHRAYWGENKVQTGGKEGTASLLPMGPIPAAGGWVRLSIPSTKLGLADAEINGVLYGIYSGKAWWGPTTTANRLLDSASSTESVEAPLAVLTTTPGSQIAYRLASPMHLSIEIADAQANVVRTLQPDSVETTGGYHIVTWDAKNNSGAQVPDAPYTVRLMSGGKVVAERPVTITPLVASILTPGSYSLVRGDQVPVIAEAYGDRFSRYTLEYGEGIAPTTWYTLTDSYSPTTLPTGRELKQFNPGNLANWNVGIDEFEPWHDEGLSGVYTLRLQVTGIEGQLSSDTRTVIVGRLAHTAEGGTISSPDGKAHLSVPALATTEAFALMAIIPVTQMEPGDAWRDSLPGNASLQGDLYELLPAGERFRRPATLEIPYTGSQDATHVGIMMGDGTPNGWRYVGGSYDAQKRAVSVPVLDFGGNRALVGVFESNSFGTPPADPAASSRIQLDAKDQAPLVTSAVPQSGTDNLFAFYSDFESAPGEWESLDIAGTRLTTVTGADAGVDESNSVLKVTRRPGGVRLVRVRSTPYNAALYPIISFDYRLPDDYAPDLFVKSGGIWWQLGLSAAPSVDTTYFKHLDAPTLNNDGEWHHYTVDLAALLQSAGAKSSALQVDEIVLGQYEKHRYMQVSAADSGIPGSAYYIDNFAALAPTNADAIKVAWTAPPGSGFSAYSAALDADINYVPADSNINNTSSDVALPQTMPDGLYYYHVAGKLPGGAWSPSTDLPVLIDRTAPAAGTAALPADAEVGGIIQIPLTDATGIAPNSLSVKLNGNAYSAGSGLTYDPLLQSINITPASLQPPVGPLNGGDQVELTLLEASDRAGNKLASPAAISFTADNTPSDSGSEFRPLTVKGGSSPSLSPDGQTLAFVSARGGIDKIWLMKADDFEEKASSANPLTGAAGAGRESSPAWSPDGQTIAFVSDVSGSPQVWLANADGQEARALTTGDGGAASPSWLAGGTRIVFVRNGNLWSVNSGGGELQPISNYPERPIKSVSAQPTSNGQLLAVGFKLYQETVEIYDPATGELRPLTEGGRDREPAWLNSDSIVFTAPSTTDNIADRQDAIWQISVHGGKPELLPNSAMPGVGDTQASTVNGASARQDLLAIVSNRGGSSNIWVRRSSSIGPLEISPPAGAAPGESTSISFVLPTDSNVTLRLLDKQSAELRTLLSDESRSAGPQEASWDGLDNSGNSVPPGDYTAKLDVKTADGKVETRYSTARIVEATGTLQLSIEQWAGESAESDATLRVTVYPAGTRTRPAATSEANNSPYFELPAGSYDTVVEYKGVRHEEYGLPVKAGDMSQVSVDLGLGGLRPALLTGEGRPLSGLASVAISKAGDPNALTLQTRYTDFSTDLGFALPPGGYDLRVQYGAISATLRDVHVARGTVAQPQVNLNSGLVRLQIDARDGEPAETGGRLQVQAVDPKDHTRTLSSASLMNPAELPLPAGTYDIRIDYGVAAAGQEGTVFGFTTHWVTGVTLQSGQTIDQQINLKLTPVTISLVDTPGKPSPAGAVTFRLAPTSEPGLILAATLTDTARLDLPEGQYSIMPEYKGADLKSSGPLGEPISVKYGEPSEHELSLAMGHLSVDFGDGQGNSLDPSGLSALAYPAGQRDTPFSTAFDTNPLDLPLRAGVDYDIVLRLTDGRTLVLSGQRAAEGESITVKVSEQDFK